MGLAGKVKALFKRRSALTQSASANKSTRQEIVESGLYREVVQSFYNSPIIHIELTNKCNFSCSYCISSKELRPKSHMDKDLALRLVEEAVGMTTEKIRLHFDGEPLMYPYFIEVTRRINELGGSFALATNGALLTDKYLDVPLNHMLVSLSVSEEDFEFRRSKLSFEKYYSNVIGHLKKRIERGLPGSIHIQVSHDYNVKDGRDHHAEHADKIVRLAAEFGKELKKGDIIEQLRSNIYKGFPVVDEGPTTLLILPHKIIDINRRLSEKTVTHTGTCDAPWTMMVVHCDGTISHCCSDLTGQTAYANVKDMSLREAWTSNKAICDVRKDFEAGKVRLPICQKCLASKADHIHITRPNWIRYQQRKGETGIP